MVKLHWQTPMTQALLPPGYQELVRQCSCPVAASSVKLLTGMPGDVADFEHSHVALNPSLQHSTAPLCLAVRKHACSSVYVFAVCLLSSHKSALPAA